MPGIVGFLAIAAIGFGDCRQTSRQSLYEPRKTLEAKSNQLPDPSRHFEGDEMRVLIASVIVAALRVFRARGGQIARLAAVPRAEWVGRRRRSEAARRVRPGQEREVEGPGPERPSSPIVVGDKLVITAFDDGKLYTIAYSRADGKEALADSTPRPSRSKLSTRPREPGRVHPGHRWRAHRLLLRLVRPVLLRPVGQGTLEVRDADGAHAWATSAPASRRSSPTAW